jgi:RNA polymerase sigma-70 factor (ECF subfamily)
MTWYNQTDPVGVIRGVNDEAIWNKHREELIRYASMLVGPADAEDLLSSVVLRVLNRHSLSALDDARSYLFKSVTNEARSLVRRRKRRPVVAATEVLPADVEPEVLDAVLGLPNRQRAAVYLTYWRDLPVVEVSQLMGCSPGSVKRYLHVARKKLREVLDDE